MTDIVERLRARDREWDRAMDANFTADDALLVQDAAEEIERLQAALRDIIKISTRNSEATLMLVAIRKCAEHALSGMKP